MSVVNRVVFIILKFLILSLILFSCNKNKKNDAEESNLTIKQVNAFSVKVKELVPEIRTFGSITFKSKADLFPKTSGRVEKINVEEGDRVSINQVLAELEQFQLIQQQKQAIAEYDAAKSSLELEKAKYNDGLRGIERQFVSIQKARDELEDKKQSAQSLKNTLDNKKKLLDAGAVTLESVKNLETSYYSSYTQYILAEKNLRMQEIGYRDKDIIDAGYKVPEKEEDKIDILKKINTQILEKEVDVAGSRLKIAKTKLDSINELIKETYIRSPINGIVASRQIEIGEEAKTDKSMFVVMDTRNVYAKINISESDLMRIKLEGEVILTVDALGKKEIKGIIRLISPIIDAKTRTVQLSVILPNIDGVLIPGMFVRAVVKSSESRKAIHIPSSSLISVDKDAGAVFLIKNGLVFKKEIKLGAENDEMIEVLSGLKDNDLIVETPSIDLVEGSKVEIKNETNESN